MRVALPASTQWTVRRGANHLGASLSRSGWPWLYEVRVEGILDCRWTEWFEGLLIKNEGRETVISGRLLDQAALDGVLMKVRGLGLSLISVRRLD